MPIGTSFPVFLLKKIRICKRHKHTRYTRENSWRLFCWMEDCNLRTMWRSEPLSRLLWPEWISYSATQPKAQMPVPCASAWLKQLNATSWIPLDTFCSFCRSFPNSETSQLVSNSCRYCLGLRRSLNIAICLDFLSITVSRCSYFLPSRRIIDRLRLIPKLHLPAHEAGICNSILGTPCTVVFPTLSTFLDKFQIVQLL